MQILICLILKSVGGNDAQFNIQITKSLDETMKLLPKLNSKSVFIADISELNSITAEEDLLRELTNLSNETPCLQA